MSPRRSARVRTRIRERDAKSVKPHIPNTKGLPTVPAELLLEILSNMQAMPIPCIDSDPINAKYKERSMALHALSQACRSLRSALLPFVWERIEVCTANGWSEDSHSRKFSRWCQNIATDLVEQLEIVTVREPSFAGFVKTVTVVVSGHSADRVLRELARCLALMPNLQTIQIIDMLNFSVARERGDRYGVVFEKAFKAYTFPSVQQVILSQRIHMLFQCFPNARKVYLHQILRPYPWVSTVDYDGFKQWLSKVAEHCRNVEEFGYPGQLKQNFMELVISTLPKLRSLQIYAHCVDVAFIGRLSELKNLEKIELVVSNQMQHREKRTAAIRVLEKSPVDAEKKMLVVTYHRWVARPPEVVKFTT